MKESQVYEAIRLAQMHEEEGAMASSAKLAAKDAVACFNKGMYPEAYERARTSLRYSVGVFHKDFVKVFEMKPTGYVL